MKVLNGSGTFTPAQAAKPAVEIAALLPTPTHPASKVPTGVDSFKAMHVSPFIGMAARYGFTLALSDRRLGLVIEEHEQGASVLT
ncbi:MAG: DUF1365 domain-containing protein, partial [Thermoleophilum sp.]|nr:DUF1365 domain-containing protein [Thermoleophilum sp.]